MRFWSRKKSKSVVIENAITDSDRLLKEAAYVGDGVTTSQAMRIGTVNTCVRVLSESVAMLPCETYRSIEGGGREKAKDEEIYDVLKYSPNPWLDSFQFWELAVKSMLLTGNFFSTKTMVRGEVREVVEFPFDGMMPQRDGNRIVYKVNGAPDLTPDKVFHLADSLPGDGGLAGESRIKQGAVMLGKVKSAEAWSKSVFDDYGVPPGYLATDQDLGASQRDEIRDHFKGVVGMDSDNDGKKGIPILTKGLEYKAPSISFADAQILDAMKYSRDEICALFRVPPHIAQFYEKSTSWGTGIEQVSLQFVSFTLLPILRRLEMAIAKQLLSRKQRQTLQVQFNVSSLLRGDMKARAEFYYKGLLMGWLSINDVRRLENMNPIEGGNGNRVPSNTEDLLELMKNESKDDPK